LLEVGRHLSLILLHETLFFDVLLASEHPVEEEHQEYGRGKHNQDEPLLLAVVGVGKCRFLALSLVTVKNTF
jgi:hypothetical protein